MPDLTKAQMQAIQRAALNRAKRLNPNRDTASKPLPPPPKPG